MKIFRRLAERIEPYIYFLLLATVAAIPLQQELTCFLVGVTFAGALLVACVRGRQQPPVLRTWEQGLLYLLLLAGIASLHLSRDQFLSSFNFVYVVGQYAAFIFVLLRYGWRRPQRFGLGRGEVDASANAERSMAELIPLLNRVPRWCRDWFFSRPRPLQLICVFLAVSVAVSLAGIMQKALGIAAEDIWVDSEKFPELKVRAYSTLVNPNILAGYLVLVIAYAAAFFNVYKRNFFVRAACGAAGCFAALCLLYTYSRGNWLACAVMLAAFCLLFCRRAALPLAGGAVFAMMVGGQAALHRLSSIVSGEDTSAALRLAYLKSTQWIIEEFPWGVGWYGYRFVYPDYNYYLADTSVIMYHCHNMFLNVLAELGWHGLALFLAVWAVFIYNAWRLAWHGREPWLQALGRGYVLAAMGMAVGGLTDHVYFNTQMGLLFWLLGLLTLLGRKLNAYCV